jgi:curved DNA-binding protein CbpA
MSKKDYHEVLGVNKDASDNEIRRAYKKLAVKWHPDKHPDNKKEAEEKFKEISEAYSVLSDPKKKSEYDNGGFSFEDFGGFDDFDPFSMFDSFFGKGFGKHGGFGNFGFDDDDDDFFGGGFGKGFGMGKNFGGFKGFDDDDFGFGGNFGGGFGGQGTSVKKTTQIINGKKITKTETTTIDKNGNKKTVVKEETGDGRVKEYYLGEDGQKIQNQRKRIGNEDEDDEEEYHHQHHHNQGNQGGHKKTTKKHVFKKK